jgi:opacity protein-like surface antigen
LRVRALRRENGVSSRVSQSVHRGFPHFALASSEASKMGYGVAFGSLGNIVGFETEFSYFPELLDNDAEALSKSKGVTFAASTLIGPTIHRIKPYGAIGAGTIYLNVANLSSIVVPNPESVSNTYFALNIGGGVGAFFSSHFGVKGDLRYFKAYGFDLNDFEGTSVQNRQFQLLARHDRRVDRFLTSGNTKGGHLSMAALFLSSFDAC